MAKKKNNLTLEEKLKNALVPEEEQSYQIPDNWVWTRLGNIAYLFTGNSISSKIKESKYFGKSEGLSYIATKDISFDHQIDYNNGVRIDDYQNFRIATSNTPLLCIEGGSSGKKIGFVLEDVCFGNKLCAFETQNLNSKLIYYYLQTDIFVNQFNNKRHGLIGGVSIRELNQISIPLPSLLEQQRIVERIESLFSKLDEAKEKIKMSLDSFENRKSAILYQAFSGELTKKWREENGVKFDDWEESTIENYATTKYGYTESANFQEIGPKYLRITDIKNGKVDWNMVPYCDISEENYRKYKLEKFDIVVARTGATTGKSYLILEGVKAVYASYLIKIEIDKVELLTPQFLYLFLQTQSYWNQIIDLSSGIAQPGVNKLKTINITVPPLEEQKEIVRILDNLFEKEQGTQELIDLIENIDLMKKSILARAFRGELGTNIPEEESAIELLKSVLEV